MGLRDVLDLYLAVGDRLRDGTADETADARLAACEAQLETSECGSADDVFVKVALLEDQALHNPADIAPATLRTLRAGLERFLVPVSAAAA